MTARDTSTGSWRCRTGDVAGVIDRRRREVGGVLDGEQLDHVGRPRPGWLFVGPVDIDTIDQSDGAEGFEPFIEKPAGVAEQVVGAIAQRQDREPQMLQPLGGRTDRLPEEGGGVGELALTERRGDRDEVRGRLQVGEVDLVQLDRFGVDTDGRDGLGEGRRGVLGVTHVGAVADDQREVRSAGHDRSLKSK